MKKTLLAFALASILSTSAHSSTSIYQYENTSFDVDGYLDAFLGKNSGTTTDVFDNNSKLNLKVTHSITDDIDVIGGTGLRFSDQDQHFSDPKTHNAYIGISHKGYGTLSVGRQTTTADEIALSKFAYTNENITLSPMHSERGIKFRTINYNLGNMGKFAFGIDHSFIGSNRKGVDVTSRSTGGGLFYTNTFGKVNFKLNGGYTYTQIKNESIPNARDREKSWIMGTQFSLGKFDLGMDHTQSNFDVREQSTGLTSPKVKTRATQIALRYRIANGVSIFTTYQYFRGSLLEKKIKKDRYTVGADYKFHKHVLAYAQIDRIKNKDYDSPKNNETAWALGVRVLF